LIQANACAQADNARTSELALRALREAIVAINFPLWLDAPAARDLLGFRDVAVPIVDAIGRDNLDPLAIGVFGPWGSGKSTLLEVVAGLLPEDCVTVRIQPWAYDPAVDPKAMLIGEVLTAVQLRASAGGGMGTEVKKQFSELFQRVRWSKALSLAARTALTFQLPSWDDLTGVLGDSKDAADSDADLSLADFRRRFAALMLDLQQVSRVVVLVDDLDRCLPATTVDVLEAIKLFLSVPKMAFVIAADETAIVEAIRPRYREAREPSVMARQYLEKIVQIPVRVPTLGYADTEAYMALLLLEQRLVGEDQALASIIETCTTNRAAGEPRLLGGLQGVPSSAADDMKLADALAPLVYRELKGNPRRIKRFLNSYWLRIAIARQRGIQLEPAAVGKLILLEELHPALFRRLLDWMALAKLTEQLDRLEAGPDVSVTIDGDEEFYKWAAMQPSLGKLHLGPYLLLAASLAQDIVQPGNLGEELAALLEKLSDDAGAVRREGQTEAVARGVDDRRRLVVALGDRLRRAVDRQRELGESLVRVAASDPALNESVATQLTDFAVADVEPVLIALLRSVSPIPKAYADLITRWRASPDLSSMAMTTIDSSSDGASR